MTVGGICGDVIFLPESKCVLETSCSLFRIIWLQDSCSRGKRCNCGHCACRCKVRGEGKPVITRAGSPAVCLIRLKGRIVDKIVSDGRTISKVVILIKIALDNALGDEAYVFYLGIDIECAVKYLLYDIRNSVRAMNIDKFRCLVNVGLIPVRSEKFPEVCKI